MSNTSATGGYLVPAVSPAPLEGQPLEDFLFDVWVGVTGLPVDMLFARYQPEPPNLPSAENNWAAFGVTQYDPDDFGVVVHNGSSNGKDELTRHEIITVLTSFYGPSAEWYMGLLRDGFLIDQNREVLKSVGMAYVDCSRPVKAPSIVKEKWLNRVDIEVRIRRVIRRDYPILNLASASFSIDNEVTDVVLTNVTFNS